MNSESIFRCKGGVPPGGDDRWTCGEWVGDTIAQVTNEKGDLLGEQFMSLVQTEPTQTSWVGSPEPLVNDSTR